MNRLKIITTILLISITALVITLAPTGDTHAAPRAEDHSVFAKLFGKKIEAVSRTRSTDDDTQLIEEMQESAASIPDSPEVQRLIYKSMIKLAADSRNYRQAASAVDQLHSQFPDDPDASPDIALTYLEKGYRASRRAEQKEIGERYLVKLRDRANRLADNGELAEAAKEYRHARRIARDINSPIFPHLQASIDRVDRQIKTDAQINELRRLIASRPSNTSATKELTLLLMINKDNPAEAAKYVEKTQDDQLIKIVQLASSDAESLTPADLIRVAEWYFQQSKAIKEDDIASQALARVVHYCDSAIEQYTARDASRLRMTELQASATARLTALKNAQEAAGKGGQWVDLIKAFDDKKHALGAAIKKANGEVTTSETDFILDVSPKAGYELKLQFVFIKGENGINLSLPLGNRHFKAAYSRANHTATGIPEAKMFRRTPTKLRKGQQIELAVRVQPIDDQNVALQFAVDNEVIIDWKGPSQLLEANDSELETPDRFGRSIRVNCGGNYRFTKILYRELP